MNNTERKDRLHKNIVNNITHGTLISIDIKITGNVDNRKWKIQTKFVDRKR